MGILDAYQKEIEQSAMQWIQASKVNDARILQNCDQLTPLIRQFDRMCISIDHPLRVTPEQWHIQSMRSTEFWVLIAVVPLLVLLIAKKRSRRSWLWVACSALAIVHTADIGTGYLSYYLLPMDDSLHSTSIEFAWIAGSVIITVIGMFALIYLEPRLVQFYRDEAKCGPLHRLRLALTGALTCLLAAATLFSVVNDSWANALATWTGAFTNSTRTSNSIFLTFAIIAITVLLWIVPTLFSTTIGRLLSWIKSGA